MDTVAGETISKRKRTSPVRNDVAVKIDRKLIGKARLIATHRGVSVAELLSETLTVPLDKMYAVMLRELEGGPK